MQQATTLLRDATLGCRLCYSLDASCLPLLSASGVWPPGGTSIVVVIVVVLLIVLVLGVGSKYGSGYAHKAAWARGCGLRSMGVRELARWPRTKGAKVNLAFPRCTRQWQATAVHRSRKQGTCPPWRTRQRGPYSRHHHRKRDTPVEHLRMRRPRPC